MRMIELTKVDTNRFNDNEEGEGQTRVTTAINADAIRCLYPRRDRKPGTRITFTDGGGFVVTESYATIRELLVEAGVIFHRAEPSTVVQIADHRSEPQAEPVKPESVN